MLSRLIQWLCLAMMVQVPLWGAISPPKSKGSHPLLGDYKELRRGIVPFLHQLHEEYDSPIVELNIPLGGTLVKRYYAVFSPQLTKELLAYEGEALIKGNAAGAFKKGLFAPEGIIFMEADQRWAELNQTYFDGPFNPRQFSERYGPVFERNMQKLLARWSQTSEPLDLYTEITHFTMQTISEGFFLYSLSNEELSQLVPAFKYLLDNIQARELQIFAMPRSIPTSENRKFKESSKTFKRVLQKIVDRDPGSVRVGNQELPSLIALLRAHRDSETGKALSDKEVLSHVGTLFFAGHDTTANLITSLIYRVWSDPEILHPLREAAHSHLAGRSLGWIPMGTVPLLDEALHEVLRLHPSVPVYSRDTTRELTVQNYRIPKGSTLLFAPVVMQQCPNRGSFLAFGYGPRRCLGQWLAQAEARSFVAQLLMADVELNLETETGERIALKMECTGIPDQKIWVSLRSASNLKCPETSPIRDFPMQVVASRFENSDHSIKTFRLAALGQEKLPLHYQVADHLILWATHPRGEYARHYTISSAPSQSDEWLEITVKEEPTGAVSSNLHANWVPGKEVLIRAPYDDGVHLELESDEPLVLISGGVGITPMIAILREVLSHAQQRSVYFFHSARTRDRLAFEAELERLAAEDSRLHLHLNLTREPEGSPWKAKRERIQAKDLVESLDKRELARARFLICGPQQMVSTMTLDLSSFGVQPSQLTELSFGHLSSGAVDANIPEGEVAKHSKASDAWIIVGERVFDITEYLILHPGSDILESYLGKDASQAFYRLPHSGAAARELLSHPKIRFLGYLATKEPRPKDS